MVRDEENDRFESSLQHLDVDKDIAYAGQLNRSHEAPEDVPDASYGPYLAHFNDHIFQRLIDTPGGFHATTIESFRERLTEVLECLHMSERYVHFKELAKFKQKKRLDDLMQQWRIEAAAAMNAVVEKEERQQKEADAWSEVRQQEVVQRLRKAVAEIHTGNVLKTLEARENQEFKSHFLQVWDQFFLQQERMCLAQVQGAWDVAFQIQPEFEMCKRKLFETLESEWSSSNQPSSEECSRLFQTEFDRYVAKLESRERPLQVDQALKRYYQDRHMPVRRIEMPGVPGVKALEGQGGSLAASAWSAIATLVESTFSRRVKASGRTRCPNLQPAISLVEEMTRCEEAGVARIFQKTEEIVVGGCKINDLHYRQHAHCCVFTCILPELKKKQAEYEATRSLSANMRSKRAQLETQFIHKILRLSGSAAAASLFGQSLREALENNMETVIVDHTKRAIAERPWMKCREAALAQLDLAVLDLLQAGKKSQACKMVNDNKALRMVMCGLIEEFISPEEALVQAKATIMNALDAAKNEMRGTDSSQTLAQQVEAAVKSLEHMVPNPMRRGVDWAAITEKLKETDDPSQVAVCVSLEVSMWSVACDVDPLTVYRALEKHPSTASRPMCDARCPGCNMQCSEPTGHTGQHDCVHQAGGIGGGSWVGSKKLVETTCTSLVRSNAEWVGKGPWKTVFERHFPKWAKPNRSGRHKVRELIFYSCQKELAKIHGLRCTDQLDADWHHSIEQLRGEAEHVAGLS
uniref:Uncharacterized protein n=1 Tax=Alexandrium catenella TaxID=2925 RepID=A0A7S1RRS8_ALECA